MASKGNSRHIKNLNAPRYFAVPRKESKYVVKADAGRHTLDKSIALILAPFVYYHDQLRAAVVCACEDAAWY